MATSGTSFETEAHPALTVSATSASYPHSSTTSAIPALVGRSSSTISTRFIFHLVERSAAARPYHVLLQPTARHRTFPQSGGPRQEKDPDSLPDRNSRT